MARDRRWWERNTYGIHLAVYWTMLIMVLSAITLHFHHRDTLEDAEAEARDYLRLNLFYRAWSAQMGGVYVSSDKVTPNPYLTIPKRDVVTSDGGKLTLVNPAYMTRMVFEMIKGGSSAPMVSNLTSLKPLNPSNAPDEWERRSLEGFEHHQYHERSEVIDIKGEPYLRLISAFVTEKACLKCHAAHGYRVGDIRGGITISVPLAGRFASERRSDGKIAGGYLIVWIVGCCGIYAGSRNQARYQQELEASERNLRTVCEWTPDWDYWKDTRGILQFVSPSCREITQYTQDEFLKDPDLLGKIIHPDYRDAFRLHEATALTSEDTEPHHIEFKIIARGGEEKWIQHNCVSVFEDNEFKGRRVSNRDITGQKAANEKISRLSAIVETSDDAILSTTVAGIVTSWNRGAEKTFGYNEQEMLGNSLQCLYPPNRTDEENGYLSTIFTGKSGEHFETVRLHKDGSLLDVSITLSPIVDQQTGQIIGISKIVRDISADKRQEAERLQLERKMLHAQKLESLGVLAGGIAHDFNNLLMAIIGNADLALMRTKKESPARDNLRNVQEAASRAADLARQMLAYSGKGTFAVENIDINLLIKEMTHMLEVSISKRAVLRFKLVDNLPSVAADATQIRQIIMNLVINASEAIGERSGVIALSTGCMNCDRAYLQQAMLIKDIPEGTYVYFEVADTGCGMDSETISKIYDPFFTTKFTGRGLGMSAVQGIIRGHNGAIKVYSEVGKGTTFKVFLPAAEMPSELFNGHSDVDLDWKGSGTVLLVDDEESVLGIGSEMLREMGFEVIIAQDGLQGVDQFSAHAEKICCVILDLTMPRMDGEQAFRALRQLQPDIKVIMTSGYNEAEVGQRFIGKGLAGFIQKPYKFSTLQETLRHVLAHP